MKEIEVDHIVAVGYSSPTWDEYIKKMFDLTNMQVNCSECHSKKTEEDKIKYGNSKHQRS
jgi:5-methylcytosine-specific restriction endonuclease McrA